MTGTPRVIDTKKLLAEVRANHEALVHCLGVHDFQEVTGRKMFGRWRCTKCTGEVDSHAFHWYTAGLHAAKRMDAAGWRPPQPGDQRVLDEEAYEAAHRDYYAARGRGDEKGKDIAMSKINQYGDRLRAAAGNRPTTKGNQHA
jgi:hypothetical protein